MTTTAVARVAAVSLLVPAVAAACMVTGRDGVAADAVVDWLRSSGHASPFVFVGMYAVATALSQVGS